MSDLVQRLQYECSPLICKKAAVEIERLRAELAEWKQAASVEAGLRREFHNQLVSAISGLEAYEDLEANLIMTNKCWSGSNVTFTEGLWDRFLEIQAMRNKALGRFAKTDDHSDLCPGGINPDWDECQKCGATSDDPCAYSDDYQKDAGR